MKFFVTALVFVASAQGVPEPLGVSDTLELDNGVNRGDWGQVSLCPTGSHAFAFQIKYQDLGYVDDTAVNGIKLYCKDKQGSTTGYITSSEGDHGTWRNLLQCPSSMYMEGMRGNVMPDQGSLRDDLGVDNVQMWCQNGYVLDGKTREAQEQKLGVHRKRVSVDGREVEAVYLEKDAEGALKDEGVWSSWSYCSNGNFVCGLQTRVEKESALTDDAGMSDFIMFCCTP